MLALTMRGQLVANFHAELAGHSISAFDRLVDWGKKAQALEDAVNEKIVFCYDNIDSYIANDVGDSTYQSYASIQDAARDLRDALKEKYAWIDWVTYGFEGKLKKKKIHFTLYECIC